MKCERCGTLKQGKPSIDGLCKSCRDEMKVNVKEDPCLFDIPPHDNHEKQKRLAKQSQDEVMSKLNHEDAEEYDDMIGGRFTIGKCRCCGQNKVVMKLVFRCFGCIKEEYQKLVSSVKEA